MFFMMALLCLARPSFALAWGIEGHSIVARIAQQRLTPEARAAIVKLLGNMPMDDPNVSSWADFIGKERPQTKPWHYVDIPTDKPAFDQNRDAPDHHCVLDQVLKFRDQLADPKLADAQKTEALKFIIHFVADLHQPLHTTARYKADGKDDRGGNDVHVVFLGENSNLHKIWDMNIVTRTAEGKSWQEFADQLNAQISDKEADDWSKGSVEDWVNQSHQLAVDVVYLGIPATNDPVVLGDEYLKTAEPVARLQLKRAGIRLAFILNRVFGKSR